MITRKRKARLIFYLAIITLSFGISFLVFVFTVRPVFLKRLQFLGKKTAVESINTAVEKTFKSYENDFSELVCLDKRSSGEIVALKADTIQMNKIRSDIAKNLEKEMDNLNVKHINIPVGNIFGNELFAGMGPDIKIKIRPIGIAQVNFSDNFEDCGINQSRHTVYIDVSASISVITKQMKTSENVSLKIPVSETVIVGNVPQYYGSNSSFNKAIE